MKKVLSFLLLIALVMTTIPMALAQDTTPTYNNSFWVTYQSQKDCTAQELLSLLQVDLCLIRDKQQKEAVRSYELVVMDWDETVEAAMERVQLLEGVVKVDRNLFASDYQTGASYVTLNQTTLEIPVGGMATLTVTDAHLVAFGHTPIGVMVAVDHQTLSYEQLTNILKALVTQEGEVEGDQTQATTIALYETDEAKGADTVCLGYSGYEDETFAKETQRLNTQSPIGEYIISLDLWGKVVEYDALVHELAQVSGVTTARIVYEQVVGGIRPQENWAVENEAIAGIAKENGDENDQFYTVTVVGRQVGETVITVEHGGGLVLGTATCTVKVVEADPETPSDIMFGDANGDFKVDAKDALLVLRLAVSTATISAKYSLAAEVDGKFGLNARDALEILKYTVGKIDRFPIQGPAPAVTPTDLPVAE